MWQSIMVWAILLLTSIRSVGGGSPYATNAPFPALIAAAGSNHISIDQIDAPLLGTNLSAGDSVTAIVSLHEKKKLMQWLVHVETTATNRIHGTSNEPPMTMYTSLGNKFEFASSLANCSVRILGPFLGAEAKGKRPAVEDKRVSTEVNKGLLEIGLEQADAAELRAIRLREANPGQVESNWFEIGDAPFSESRIARSRKSDAVIHLTPQEERALAGSTPALLSYFELVSQTPGLDDLLYKVVSLPSGWSLIRHLGIKSIAISFGHSELLETWKLPGHSSVYRLPMHIVLDNHKALELQMDATDPTPPLLLCGGIIGFRAENPENKEVWLTLEIVSAQFGVTNLIRR